MTLTLILLPHARVAQLVSTRQQALRLALTARQAMWTTTVMRLRSVWSAVWVGMLERGARRVWTVSQAGTTTTWTLLVTVSVVQPGTALHQGLPAARSVQRVGKTLTLILEQHAWTVR